MSTIIIFTKIHRTGSKLELSEPGLIKNKSIRLFVSLEIKVSKVKAQMLNCLIFPIEMLHTAHLIYRGGLDESAFLTIIRTS